MATIDETNGANVHGVIADFIIEPENADANANGVWAIFCMPDELSTIPVPTIALMEAEGSNAFVWATGVWAASNQTPFCKEIKLGTSRNCQNGARIVLKIYHEGVSAGLVRNLLSLVYFTKSL